MCTINDFHSNIPKLVVVYFQESKVVSSKKVKINQFDAYMQVRLNETAPLIYEYSKTWQINQNVSTIKDLFIILTIHLVAKVLLVIQMLSPILQVSTILQSTIARFYCTIEMRVFERR